MNWIRISGIVLRQMLLIRRSIHRIFELFYWVTLELFLWGFITIWLQGVADHDRHINFVLFLLGGLIFWDLFSRTQQTVATSFLEDVWSRNVVNIFAAPVSKGEFLTGLVIVSVIRGLIALGFVAILAFFLYHFRIWQVGFYFLPLVANLFVFGWALGFVIMGIIIRFGLSVEILAWSIPILIQPLSAVFYPVSILPDFLQRLAFLLPTTHMFEGMRQVLLRHTLPWENILWASLLNGVYFVFSVVFFGAMLRTAKRNGFLVRLSAE
ncbi:MAG: ABC transporter permease [Armatimonadetes bacterium]|nr:ABC transporter permease [Armatimonadota bacterium]